MKAKRFSQEQIIGVLKEAEAGAKTKDLCRRHEISEATFYNWKAQVRRGDGVGGAAVEGARAGERQAQTTVGRSRARQSGAEGSIAPKMVNPQAKRAAVETLMTERSLEVTRACGAGGDFALAVSLSQSASGLHLNVDC